MENEGRDAEANGTAQGVRIIAHVRHQPTVDPDASRHARDQAWAQLAAPLLDRASALGGRLVAWGDEFVCVAFAWDALYDAVDFLVDAPLAPELASGLCHGEVRVLYDAGRVAPSVGPPIRLAAEIAELARPGEVLVSPELVRVSGRLGTVGEAGRRPGRPDVAASILDLEQPLREPVPSAPVASLDFEAEEPQSLRGRELLQLVNAADAMSKTSLFPKAMGAALSHRDGASLAELSANLRREQSTAVAERLDAMAQLASGRSGDAIRRLRKAKEETDPADPSALCRSTLALAVALFGAGRKQEALLEGLSALGQARRASDHRGEHASTRFLSQIAHALADERSASSWLELSHRLAGALG